VTVNPLIPLQGHLSLTQANTEMRLMWVSASQLVPEVVYGNSPGNYTFYSKGTTDTYVVEDMCGLTAQQYYLPPGNIHDVLLTELRAGASYFYRFGSKIDGWSEEYSFVAPSLVGPDVQVDIIAFADSGTGICQDMLGWCEGASIATTNLIQKELSQKHYDMALHIGDISYAVGYAHRWEQFFAQWEPIATQVPYMVCIGNHEYDFIQQDFQPSWGDYGNDSFGECGVPYNKRFHMTGNDSPTKNLWFSYNYGSVHLVFISTEHNFTAGSPQSEWLEQDLEDVNKSITPWIILSGHRPLYTSNAFSGDQAISVHMRTALEPLMLKYGVDLGLWGHVHNYERTCPVFNEECISDNNKAKAPVHVVVGNGGQELITTWNWPQPSWSVFRVVEFGYSRIHVANSTALLFEYVSDREDGGVHDSFWLTK